MRLVPRRYRFRAAVRLALAVTPLLVRAGRFPPGRLMVDTPREQTLFSLLDLMTRYGCRFDPEVEFEGAEILDALMERRRGLLIACPHAMLTILIMRHLLDRGTAAIALVGAPPFQLMGADTLMPAMRAKQSLLRVRTLLRQGKVVVAMIDRRTQDESRYPRFRTATGEFAIADPLLSVARRLGVPVAFAAYRLTGTTVRARAVPAPEHGDVDELVHAFAGFVRELVGG